MNMDYINYLKAGLEGERQALELAEAENDPMKCVYHYIRLTTLQDMIIEEYSKGGVA